MGIHDRNYTQDVRSVSTFSTLVYSWMALGLVSTASVAFFLFHTGLYRALMPLWWVWVFGAFAIGMTINVATERLSVGAVAALFLAYSALEGVLFGTILPVVAAAHGGQVVWAAFLTAAVCFGLAVGYGAVTKQDLTGLGRILSLALVGFLVVTLLYAVLSFFFPMKGMYLLMSYVGLVLFVGLTAFDAQVIRRVSQQFDTSSVASYKMSLVLALKMYVNVVMIFWYLLQIFSSDRR